MSFPSGTRLWVVAVFAAGRDPPLEILLVTCRTPRRRKNADLQGIVARFSHLLPGVHTRSGVKAPQAPGQGPTCGATPRETSVARQAQRHAERNS